MWLWNIKKTILVILQICGILTKEKPFVDVFLPGLPGGKPSLGTPSATCWARGGVCMDVRYCTTMKFDSSVAGCTRGYKVCCKIFKFGSPTVGPKRKSTEFLVFSSNLREFEQKSIQRLALKNSIKLQYIHDMKV